MSKRLPTLIVGIGGIGCQIAADVYRRMDSEDAETVSVLGIDTDTAALSDYEELGMRTIQISEDKIVGEFLKEHPEFEEWFPKNPFLENRGMLKGAGQVRALSRLAMITSMLHDKFTPLDDEISRIMENRGEAGATDLTVMLVGSNTGGTGAGMFIQLPLYIRSRVQEITSVSSVLIRGLFIGADITEKVQLGEDNRKAVNVNDYSCIKELNAFYLNQTKSLDDINIKIEHYNGNEYPYDYLFLLQDSGKEGTHGEATLDAVIQKAGEMTYFQLLTPIINNSKSAEDNFVLSLIDNNGMNRYASVGLGRIVYPYEQVKEYCTLQWINDLIGDYWLLLDKEYAQLVRTAAVERQNDPYFEMPDRQQEFIKGFREQCGVGGEKMNCPLANLRDEAFVSLGDMNNNYMEVSASYFEEILNLIETTLLSPEVMMSENRCKVKEDNMLTLATANEEVGARLGARKTFQEALQKQVKTCRTKIISEILPGSLDGIVMHKDEPYNIFNLIGKVHPLTARFFLYTLKQQIEEANDFNDVVLSNKKVLEIIENTDFLDVQDDKQTPTQALEYFSNKENSTAGGLWGAITSMVSKKEAVEDSEAFKEFTAVFKQTMAQWTMSTKNYYKAMLSKGVLEGLLRYVETLIDLYEKFFDTLDNVVTENKDALEQLTDLLAIKELGVMKVCCDKKNLKVLYRKLETECIQNKWALPENVKMAVFNELYEMFVEKKDNLAVFEGEEERRRIIAQEKIDIMKVFKNSVVREIRYQIEEKGGKVLDRNVKQMIYEQYHTYRVVDEEQLPEKLRAAKIDEEEGKRGYLQEMIGKGLKLADPWILVDEKIPATMSAYVGINGLTAVQKDGTPDKAASGKEMLSAANSKIGGRETGIIIGKEFSKYEIVCYKARYALLVEELKRYAPGSRRALCYKERLDKINSKPKGKGLAAENTVINPHLCSYWNQEAYMPALLSAVREQEKKETLRAFIYALTLDRCSQGVDEDYGNCKTWFFEDEKKTQTVKIHGEPIANGYYDLLKSMKYNRYMKAKLLEFGKAKLKEEKSNRDMDTIDEDILDHELIRDITFNSKADADENLIDLLKRMRKSMVKYVEVAENDSVDIVEDDSEFEELVEQFLVFIEDYCKEMLYGSAGQLNRVCQKIVDRIIANSEVVKAIREKKENGDALTKEEKTFDTMAKDMSVRFSTISKKK